MLFSVFGTPSNLTDAVNRACHAVVEGALGSCTTLPVGSMDEVHAAVQRAETEHLLTIADAPATDVAMALADAARSVIMVLEPPVDVVRAVQTARSLDWPAAIRLAGQSFATLHDLALSPRTHRLGLGAADMPLAELLGGVAAAFGLSLDSAALDRVLTALVTALPDDPQRAPAEATLRWLTVPAAPAEAVPAATIGPSLSALKGFESLLAGHPVTHFRWPPQVFLGDRPLGEPLTGPVQLIGARRCFIFGPYLHLPRGTWRATVDFTVRDNISGNILKIDIFNGTVLTEGSARLPAEGHLTCTMTMVIGEPRLPLEIRLWNMQGAIEGSCELHAVDIERVT